MCPFSWCQSGLIALLLLDASHQAPPARRFDAPQERGYRVDACLTWGADCGKPAADAFCRRNGFAAAESFQIAENIGAARPTMTLGDQRICNQPDCDGFRSITCRAPEPREVPKPAPRPLPDPAPRITLIHYQPARGYDPQFLCWKLPVKDVGSLKKGQRVWTCGGSGGGFSVGDVVEGLGGALVDGVTGLASLGAPVVNWASSTYNSAKSAAVGVVVDSLKNTVGCGAECQWAVGAAVDAGMMAMGVPPTLPDFDQLTTRLTDQGIDALADAAVSAAASQGVPLPKEVAKAAIHKLKNDALVAMTSGGAHGSGDILKPDPALAYHPASMVFEARNTEGRPTAPMTLRVVNGKVQTGPGKYDFMTTTSGGGRFHTVNLPLPSLKPGTAVRFLVGLDPHADPHEWLAITDQAWGLILKAGALPSCQAPAAMVPDKESPAYKKYQQCRWQRDLQAAAFKQEASKKYSAAAMSRDAWTKTYTTTDLGFEIRLLSHGQTLSENFVRCPPRAGPCHQ